MIRHKRVKQVKKNRRRRGAAAGHRFAPTWLRLNVLKRDGYRCRYCGRALTYATAQMDHVVPWPYGMTEYKNLRTACPDCNREKGSRHPGQRRRPRVWKGMRDDAPEENGPVRVRKVGLPVSVSPPW